jgi:hypothetical protein
VWFLLRGLGMQHGHRHRIDVLGSQGVSSDESNQWSEARRRGDPRRRRAIVVRSASCSGSRGGIVMMDERDMSMPVIRGELREELGVLRTELAALRTQFDEKLDLWGGALMARIESSERRLLAELARHTRAIEESIMGRIAVVDEKYADLPGRVEQLEANAGVRPPR